MLTADQINALAPDESSRKAAKGLGRSKWPLLGFTEEAIWGECSGSGSKPYQVIIDLSGPSFKCSCPSRKFPCKHGLALFLLRLSEEAAFQQGNPPTWVAEWMSARKERAEKQAAKAESPKPAAAANPEVAAKREARRLDTMQEGARDLQRWLADLVKNGLADLPSRPSKFWHDTAARMVDAQSPGLAYGVRLLDATVSSGEGWPQRTLVQMGRLHLLGEALGRVNTLPEPLQQEVRSACGWTADKDEVLRAGERVQDQWIVQGIRCEENDRLWERRVWLRGKNSGRHALLLDFSHGQRRFETTFAPGMTFEATLAYFPAAFAQRALLAESPKTLSTEKVLAAPASFAEALHGIADGLAQNPWLSRLPLALSTATPVLRAGQWTARDSTGHEVPLRMDEADAWQLLAVSGGHPLTLFGEWLGESWRPLCAWQEGRGTPCWTENSLLA